MNVVVQKNIKVPAKIEFYFTSSSPGIEKEIAFTSKYGMKIGEIEIPDEVPTRIFSDVKKMYFKPVHDYYGTLVIVPYNCNATFANISLTNYGDYGFSPGAMEVLLPFPINIANESFTLKSELLDQNSTLIFSTEPVVQSFDPSGASLFGSTIIGSVGTTINIPTTLPVLTVQGNFYLPGISAMVSPERFLAYRPPTHSPPLSGEGQVGYTNISELSLVSSSNSNVSKDYINLSQVDSSISYNGRSLAVRYSGEGTGIRIFVNPAGTKTTET